MMMQQEPAPPPANPRAMTHQARHALLARGIGRWVQLVFFISLFVLWQVMHWPLGNAAEICIAAGILVYSALNVYAAAIVAWTGPVLVARISRLVAVLLYILMRYVLHYSFWHSLAVWGVLWIVSALLVGHSRRRAKAATPLPISHVR